MLFSVIAKNLDWEILTKNLVTFKRWDGVKDEKFQYHGGSLKNQLLRKVVYVCGKKQVSSKRLAVDYKLINLI